MLSPLGPTPSHRPARAVSQKATTPDGAAGFADRFQRDLDRFSGGTLDEVRAKAEGVAASETAQAQHQRRKGWLVGVAAGATWLAVPFVGTLVAAPIFLVSRHAFQASREHREQAEEAGWFLAHLPGGQRG